MWRTWLLVGLVGLLSGCAKDDKASDAGGVATMDGGGGQGGAGAGGTSGSGGAGGTGGTGGRAPLQDAGMDANVDSEAGTDANGMCQAEGAACDSEGDCCEGLSCNLGASICCDELDTSCGRPTDESVIGKTLLDFSAAQVDAEAIENAGHSGVIHYASPPREAWMLAKPVTKPYADSLAARGLFNVSNYQFGKGTTSDWRFGFDNGVACAQEAVMLHEAAGGPPDAIIYASIDDNPTLTEFNELIGPYLQGWESVIGKARLGVYANYRTINWCLEDGYGSYFWQHYWNGTGDRSIHASANVTQERIDMDTVDGTGVDINVIRKADFGQWHW